MIEQVAKLLAASAQTSSAVADMTEAAHNGEIRRYDNIGSGETLVILADGMRLLIEAMELTDAQEDHDEDIGQLHGALVRFLEGSV